MSTFPRVLSSRFSRTLLAAAIAVGGCHADSSVTGTPADGTVAVDATHPADAAVAAAGATDQSGVGNSVSATGTIDPSNAFFASLGTNGRSCATCHVQAAGWTLTPANVQARFAATAGADPLFRLVDGAISPDADVSTPAAMQSAYRTLLAKAVIRIGLPVPSGAEFTLTAVDDPYGFASAAELSLFRRPLPSTNLRFLSSVMWDGREPSLAAQATDATLDHAQATSTDASQIDAIVAFETALTTAQVSDTQAGSLSANGATGGPAALATVGLTPGENDPFTGNGFDPNVFSLYAEWAGGGGGGGPGGPGGGNNETRAEAIARGEQLFDTHPITITGVAGLNDQPGRATVQGTCSTCHDATSAGSHSVALLLDLGLTTAARRTADQPLYTFQRTADGTTMQSTDPGAALVTGKWADLNKFKVPVLRGVAMRPPYFHNGSAASLAAVVTFYDTRFRIGLAPQDQADIVAFLQSL